MSNLHARQMQSDKQLVHKMEQKTTQTTNLLSQMQLYLNVISVEEAKARQVILSSMWQYLFSLPRAKSLQSEMLYKDIKQFLRSRQRGRVVKAPD